MKKIAKLFALSIAICILVLTLAACGGGNVAKSGTATVVIDNGDGTFLTYEVNLSELDEYSEGAFSLLKHLGSIEENPLTFSMVWGGYGAYLTAIGSISENSVTYEYIYVYTSNSKDFDTSEYAKELDYEGQTLKSSGVGVSSMNIEDGTVVLFRLEGF